MKYMNAFLKLCLTSCLVLLISGCVVLGDDENVPGSDPADMTDAADTMDASDVADAADTTDTTMRQMQPMRDARVAQMQNSCNAGSYCEDGECVAKRAMEKIVHRPKCAQATFV